MNLEKEFCGCVYDYSEMFQIQHLVRPCAKHKPLWDLLWHNRNRHETLIVNVPGKWVPLNPNPKGCKLVAAI